MVDFLIGLVVGVVLTLVGVFAFKKAKQSELKLDPSQFEPGKEKRHNELET